MFNVNDYNIVRASDFFYFVPVVRFLPSSSVLLSYLICPYNAQVLTSLIRWIHISFGHPER